MARKDQGNSLLTLKQQARPTFTTVEGGFDTGRRVFVCDVTVADRLEPRLHEPDTTHRRMYISQVERVDEENGVTRFTVDYLGLKNGNDGKNAAVEEDADSQFLSEVPNGGTLQPVTYVRPVPTVTRTYVSKTKPSILDVGIALKPPGFPALVRPKGYQTLFLFDQQTIFEGWILKKRTNRQAGGGILVETTDVHSYELIQRPT